MTHVTCRLTAKNRDQLRSLILGTGVVEYRLLLPLLFYLLGIKGGMRNVRLRVCPAAVPVGRLPVDARRAGV